jgi:phosphatidylinositol-3-phosphatase
MTAGHERRAVKGVFALPSSPVPRARTIVCSFLLAAVGVIALSLGLSGPGSTNAAASAACGTAAGPANIRHVVWVFMENHSYNQIIGNTSEAPYLNQLSSQCGLATNYFAVSHPSLPNYIAATSGSTQGITDDNPPADHPLAVDSIYSQVKAAGMQWRDYEESAPGNCPSDSSGEYAVKHDPAPYYTGIAADCAQWDVPLGTTSSGNLLNDLNAGSLPAFSFVTPNLCNDMHDCSISTGDNWLQSWIPKITSSANYQAGNTAIFITWDEDDGSSSNHVATIVISPYTPAGATSGTEFTHYSLLKTSEQLLGINTFLANAAGASSMVSAFFSGVQTPPPTTTATTGTTGTTTTTTSSTTTTTASTSTTTPTSSTTPTSTTTPTSSTTPTSTTTPTTTTTPTSTTTSSSTSTTPDTTPSDTSTTGSTTETSTTTSTSTSTSTSSGGGPLPYNYVFNFGNKGNDIREQTDAGWNLLDVSSRAAADTLPPGTRGLVWIGDYDDATCAFDQSASKISNVVTSAVGDEKVAGYLLSDEPDATLCPQAPAQHAERTSLIHNIDPTKFTVVVLNGHDPGPQGLGQFPAWAGTTDFQAIDPYPCYQGQSTCDFGQIDAAVAAADAAGLSYWGVIQAFSDSTWRMPTDSEEQTILEHWCTSNWEGAMTFAWDYGKTPIPAGVLDVLGSFNTSGCPTSTGGTATALNGATTLVTSSAPDTTPPTAPRNVRVSDGSRTSLTLNWDSSIDDTGVAGYKIYRDGVIVATLGADIPTSYFDPRLSCWDDHTYAIQAFDWSGNVSPRTTYKAVCSFH